jgi:aminopeptidase N
MIMKLGVCLSTALLLSQLIFTQTLCYLPDPEAGMRPRNADFLHLKLEITLFPEKGLIKGFAEHTFTPLQQKVDSIFLDAPSIIVHKVNLNDKPATYETNNSGIIIRFNPALTWGNTHRITIEYETTPRKGLYFIGWNQKEPQHKTLQSVRKQIWTQGQGIDNRHWIPMFDDMSDKITSEVIVSFDKNYRVLSNGTLIISKEKKDGTRLWHYKMTRPHAPYLIMLAIGNYDVRTTKSKNGVVVNNWYYPEFPETVEPTFRYTEQMIDWMEQEFGVAYPWEQYSQVPVQNFMYGAMENTTATIFGDFYLVDARAFVDRNYISTNAHELVHQWFGNYVTAWSAEDVWLQESFATHYQKHFERSIFGDDHFHWNRRNELNTALAAAKENNNPIRHTKAGTARIYPKGSLVLDMLRYVLGDTQFQKAVTHYLKKYPYQNVNTDNFKMSFHESLGVNLDWFFEQWIYRGGEPHYKVDYADIIKNGKRYTEFQVVQAHEQNDLTGLFKMPIVFRVHYKDGSMDEKKEWIAHQYHTVIIPNDHNKEIDFVLFDPNSWLIKNVTFKKPLEALKSQAAKAPNMIDRYDALLALESEPFSLKKDFLIGLYKNEPFYGCRAEIVKQLVREPDSLDASVISLFVHDIHPRVRQSAIENIPASPQSFAPLFEKLLTDSSYLVVEKTLEKLSNQYPDRLEKYLEITKNDIGTGSAVRIKWLELASALNKQYLNELIDRSGTSYEFRTRVNAFEALKRLNYLDETVALNLLDAVIHFNNRLSGPAKRVASYFKEQTEYKIILSETYKNQNWQKWQDDLLQSFLK